MKNKDRNKSKHKEKCKGCGRTATVYRYESSDTKSEYCIKCRLHRIVKED